MRVGCYLAISVSAVTLAACGQSPSANTPPRGEQPKLFLAGDGEMWVVDVASERARRVPMPQLAPGDPSSRIVRRGRALALWGYDIWRFDARASDRPLRRIVRKGWYFLASADPDRIWVTFLGSRSPATVLRSVREITIDGVTTVPARRPPRGAWPQLAVRRGLIFGTFKNWYLWSPMTGRVLRTWESAELGSIGAAHGDVIASCAEPCVSVWLTNAHSGTQRRMPVPLGWSVRITEAAFSPSGRTLAAPAHRSGRADGLTSMLLLDVANGGATIVPGSHVPPGYTLARWSRGGAYVFLTGGGGRRAFDRVIVVHRVGSPSARRLRVQVGAFYDAAAY